MVTIQSLRHEPRQNYLLAALPAEVFGRLFPHLELVALPLGDVLCESGGQLQYVYFQIHRDHLPALHHGNPHRLKSPA